VNAIIRGDLFNMLLIKQPVRQLVDQALAISLVIELIERIKMTNQSRL